MDLIVGNQFKIKGMREREREREFHGESANDCHICAALTSGVAPEWRSRENPYYVLLGSDLVLPIYNIVKEAKND